MLPKDAGNKFETVVSLHTSNSEVIGSDGLARFTHANNHEAKLLTHISQRGCKGKDTHDLGSDSDVESGLALELLSGCGTSDDASEESVADIQHTVPGNGLRVNIKAGES